MTEPKLSTIKEYREAAAASLRYEQPAAAQTRLDVFTPTDEERKAAEDQRRELKELVTRLSAS